jgi:HEPN domain-containing protein
MNNELEKLKNLSMPRDSIFYEDLSVPDQWFLMAKAFIDCSRDLFFLMMNETIDSSFYHAKAAAYLLSHSLELFLKGGIIQAGGDASTTHDLQQLYNHFKKLYQGKIYEFEGDIVNAVRNDPRTPVNQFVRYPTDLSGQPWQSNTNFDLVTWYKQVILFGNDYGRLEPLLKQQYPNNAIKINNKGTE